MFFTQEYAAFFTIATNSLRGVFAQVEDARPNESGDALIVPVICHSDNIWDAEKPPSEEQMSQARNIASLYGFSSVEFVPGMKEVGRFNVTWAVLRFK